MAIYDFWSLKGSRRLIGSYPPALVWLVPVHVKQRPAGISFDSGSAGSHPTMLPLLLDSPAL